VVLAVVEHDLELCRRAVAHVSVLAINQA